MAVYKLVILCLQRWLIAVLTFWYGSAQTEKLRWIREESNASELQAGGEGKGQAPRRFMGTFTWPELN